jgi:hypothetical protein
VRWRASATDFSERSTLVTLRAVPREVHGVRADAAADF